MKALFFDCFSGISGDMTLGALLDLGLDPERFKSELHKLGLSGYDLDIRKTTQNSICGTDVNVAVHDASGQPLKRYEAHEHGNAHSRHHAHAEHGEHPSEEHHHDARNLQSIEALIGHSDLNYKVKECATKVFREIARAEAKVHGKDIRDIHFHEVGAVDSIVDIVGSAICLDMLDIDAVYCSPIHDGQGFITCRHGVLPVPVPAVMEMLAGSGIPYVCDDVATELVTPTGMGLIKCLASQWGAMPAMSIDRVGYGFGKRETGRFNALRIVAGTLLDAKDAVQEIVELETNIDDMNPEVIGFAIEKLFQQGALDVYTTPIYMKKSRPAVKLTVLAECSDEERLTRILFTETSTLGIRKTVKQRFCMARETVTVETPYGDMRVKVATAGDVKKFAPEYEDCKSAAEKHGAPLSAVYDAVREAASRLT